MHALLLVTDTLARVKYAAHLDFDIGRLNYGVR
jgi:hypothetical protein